MTARALGAIALAGAVGWLAAGSARAADGEGKELYERYCAQCHGSDGAGAGVAADRVVPRPRDFTPGKYKFRTTPSGMLPTDADLERVIRQGLAHTTMPAWPNLTDAQVRAIVEQLKTFSPAFADPGKRAEPIEIPEPPASSAESIERGKVLYAEQGCAACHGEVGRGDGTSAPTLTDDWGHAIRPADMTERWTFRGGPTRHDIFRTFSTGLNGTPMPSYADTLAVEDRWRLVDYIVSLGKSDTPDYATLFVATHVQAELDLAKAAELFEHAPSSRFPLAGQVIEPGRNFTPSASSVEIRAVHNRREIAFMVRWHDMRAETTGRNAPDIPVPMSAELEGAAAPSADAGAGEGGDDFWGNDGGADEAAAPQAEAEAEEDEGGFWDVEETGGAAGGAAPGEAYSDAVALQFPSVLPEGIAKPYFIFGDATRSVDLWFVDLASPRVTTWVGRGSADVTPSSGEPIESVATYDRGEWTVVYKRSMRASSGVGFAEAQFVPVAFSVWDGFNAERGNRRALSSWFFVYVEPAERVSAVGPMARAALGTLAVELLIVFWIRRRFAGRRSALDASRAGGVAERGLAH